MLGLSSASALETDEEPRWLRAWHLDKRVISLFSLPFLLHYKTLLSKQQRHLGREYGSEEHLRRQIYALTTMRYHGLYLGIITVLEWPKATEGFQVHFRAF